MKLAKKDTGGKGGVKYAGERGNDEGLYAVKVINKTVLKRMRTMTREGRKMTVHTVRVCEESDFERRALTLRQSLLPGV